MSPTIPGHQNKKETKILSLEIITKVHFFHDVKVIVLDDITFYPMNVEAEVMNQ